MSASLGQRRRVRVRRRTPLRGQTGKAAGEVVVGLEMRRELRSAVRRFFDQGDEQGVDLQAGELFRGHQAGAAGVEGNVAATTSAPRKRRRTIWMWLRSEYSSSA